MADLQKELFAQPRHSPLADVAWFESFLLGGKCWFTASDILLTMARPASDANKRWLRQLASQSDLILSGQLGYRAIANATAEEINHAANGLESQGRLMCERAIRIRRSGHRILG